MSKNKNNKPVWSTRIKKNSSSLFAKVGSSIDVDKRLYKQDIAASIPIRLLGNISGKRVLDLCAAPGAKTLQLASLGANVTSVDISASRLELLRENLERCGLHADIIESDAFDIFDKFSSLLSG